MDLIAVCLFLGMYYLRPQEWSSLFATIHFAQLVMMFAALSLFFRQKPVQLRDFVRTPHDWMMLAFYAWIVFSSPDPIGTFKATYSLPVTYFILCQTLYSIPRIAVFAGVWTFMIAAIAALAVVSEWGFDPLGSYDLTHGRMKDRLALNLSIFKNPNALGHNVIAAIPMLYFFCIWKRPFFIKEIGALCMILPLYCIYLTKSKGAFLAGAATILATLTFGRPKWVQIAIVSVSLIFGGTAVWALPRMHELQEAKSDAAIMGRVAAFTHGLDVLHTRRSGIGQGQWLDNFKETHGYNKAAHSSYVQIGAELGYPGFALFLGIVYCSLRTVVTARTRNPEEERIRRILFVLVVTYMISSWMVDFGYRPTFFMFTAAIAALHRQLAGIRMAIDEEDDEKAKMLVPAWKTRLLAAPVGTSLSPLPLALETRAMAPVGAGTAGVVLGTGEESRAPGIAGGWNRIGILDVILILLMTKGAVEFWKFVLTFM